MFDRVYFEAKVEPLIDSQQIEFIGEIDEHQKSAFLGNALALLFPISWPGPFGLVIIEAMACGTPVIAFIRFGARNRRRWHGFVVDAEHALSAVDAGE